MKKKYYVRDLERLLKVQRKTFFYWEKAGKVPKSKREPMSNYRYWSMSDLKRLKRIIAGGER